MSTAPEAFDAHAADYDALRRRLVPSLDAFYDAAVAALALASRPLRRVLDLGAGTGLLAERVGAAVPGAELTLLDGSPAMLATARARLGVGVVHLLQDFADDLPAGPWDAVVSALAIHHVEDTPKRRLFAQVHERLAPGGVFVNAEQVAGPTPRLDELYAGWHRTRSAQLGTTAREWADAERRMSYDHLATLESQLQWLRDAGFEDVDCLFKQYAFAVIVGRRAA
jgi:tRNA (cmo5U34)-methyltransferase